MLTKTAFRISGYVNDSIVDGPGIRFTVFVQGCPHKCIGCHNPQTHSFTGGEVCSINDLLDKIKANPLLDGITISGGEPFCQPEPLAELAKAVHELGLSVITYTGYTFEELYGNCSYRALLEHTDWLIDGKYIESEKDWQLKFRGSKNQRYLDCQASLKLGRAVEIIM